MKKACRPLLCSLAAGCLVLGAAAAWGQSVHITSAPNVVGSGARALGMGGAFIAVADDATAASWNPGGLTQLERPEISLVYDFDRFSEDFSSDSHPELSGGQDINLNGVNYLSVVYPIPWTLGGRNFVVSLNYQRKYDFDRKLRFRYFDAIAMTGGMIGSNWSNIDYKQKGQLAALSPAFGFEISDKLSVGMVLNLWHQAIMPDNEWSVTADERKRSMINGAYLSTSWVSYRYKEEYENFRGVNCTLGMMYKPTDRLSLGMVYHSGFTGDVDYTRSFSTRISTLGMGFVTGKRHQEMEFPWALGAGAAYRFPNDKLTLSLDVTYRAWDDFIVRDPHNRDLSQRETSGVTGLPAGAHDVNGTWTVRAGAEYVFVNDTKPKQDLLPSVRAGVFYDPEPASHRPNGWLGLGRGDGKPDDYFGATLGAGVLIMDRVNLDLAYVYRWGSGVRQDSFGLPGTDADVGQHYLYLSTVIYF